MADYVLFCDESGQRDYGPKTDRYFVVAGVAVKEADVENLNDELRGLKRAFCGVPNLELKSNWIRIPDMRRKHYLDKHGLAPSDIDALVDSVIKWVRNAPITFIAGVVNKPGMEDKYVKPHYPGTVAYTLTMQRFQGFLNTKGGDGDVVFDDPAGKSPKGNEWRELLRRLHGRLRRDGCPYTGNDLDDIGAFSLADSAEETFVQIADIVSYNTFRQFRDHGTAYDNPATDTLMLYPQFSEIAGKFHQRAKVFAGEGIALWPASSRNKWKVPQ